MTSPLHIGFTGTRHRLSLSQYQTVTRLVRDAHASFAHHGCCIGGDHQFHNIARHAGLWIVGHPGPGWPDGPLCARVICDEVRDPATYAERNQAIVNEVSRDDEDGRSAGVMIAAPLQDEPGLGGTWSTIRKALRALRAGKLGELYVVGRDGQLLDHGAWL